LNDATSTSETNGEAMWEPMILNHAVMELLREFPKMDAERVVQAVNVAAQTVKPVVGRVVLMQKARERLR
jgi:hypothetical protein